MRTAAVRPLPQGATKALVLEGLEEQVFLHVLGAGHTTESLARAVGVSAPTVSRALARLRRALRAAGMDLGSIRLPEGYRFEVRGHAEYVRQAWPGSRLRGLAGAAVRDKERPLKAEDEAVYGRDW